MNRNTVKTFKGKGLIKSSGRDLPPYLQSLFISILSCKGYNSNTERYNSNTENYNNNTEAVFVNADTKGLLGGVKTVSIYKYL